MKYNKIIVDSNNIFARAYGVIDKTLSSQDALNSAIHLATKMILKIKEEYLLEDGVCYLLADNPTSKLSMRKNIDSTYKVNRIKESDGYYRAIDYVLLLFSYYSEQFKTSRLLKMEADDLVPAIIRTFNQNDKVLLVSTDLDWARCMSQNVDWLDNKDLLNQQTFKGKYKFIPDERTVTIYKVLLGDKSDNIPPIKGLNEQTVLNIISSFKDVFDLLDCLQKNTTKAYDISDYTKKIILENKSRIITNHNLVYFNEVSDSDIKQATINGQFNMKALQILYQSLNFPINFDKRIESKQTSFGDIFTQFDQVNRK